MSPKQDYGLNVLYRFILIEIEEFKRKSRWTENKFRWFSNTRPNSYILVVTFDFENIFWLQDTPAKIWAYLTRAKY